MTFDVAADAYDRFMGRYSAQLSSGLADAAPAEALPFKGCEFDAVLAQLVVHFMSDGPRAWAR